MKKGTYAEIISSLFILLFTYTALSKLYDIPRFEAPLRQSPLISHFAPQVAYAIPAVELLISTLLFFRKSRKYGLYSSLALMSLFTLYIGYMVIFSPHLPCSCGGIIQKMTWTQHLIFNIIFTALAGIAIRLESMNDLSSDRLANTKISYS